MPKSYEEIPFVNVAFLNQVFWTGELSQMLARLATEHGPIFRWVSDSGPDAGQARITMVGPEANKFVMHTGRDHFSNEIGWEPFIGETFGKGLLNMDDPEHARHRKMWNPAFAASYMGAYLPVMQSVIRQRTSHWPEQDNVDVYDEAREITFDIAAAALAGFRPGPEIDRMRELFYALIHGFDESVESFEVYITRAMQMREELVTRLLGMIRERRMAPPEERPRDVLGSIVFARDENGEELSDAQVLAHLNILLIAGHETTTTLSAWAIYLLSTMPEERARIMAEINALPGSNDGGAPSIDDLRSLKALDNFVRETGRLYPPVIHVPRGVVSDFEFAGYTVPEGAHVRLALGGSHRLPEIFKNPDAFEPDRLAPPREEDKHTPYSLVTFGGGAHLCIGQHFANIEAKALLVHLLRNYTFEPVEGQNPTHAGFINAFIPGGIRMRFKRA